MDAVDVYRAEIGSLQDYVSEQLNLVRMSDTDWVIATAIVDALSDDGYLSLPVEDLHQSLMGQGLEIDEDEVVAVLRQVSAALKQREVDTRADLDEPDVLAVLYNSNEAKERAQGYFDRARRTFDRNGLAILSAHTSTLEEQIF